MVACLPPRISLERVVVNQRTAPGYMSALRALVNFLRAERRMNFLLPPESRSEVIFFPGPSWKDERENWIKRSCCSFLVLKILYVKFDYLFWLFLFHRFLHSIYRNPEKRNQNRPHFLRPTPVFDRLKELGRVHGQSIAPVSIQITQSPVRCPTSGSPSCRKCLKCFWTICSIRRMRF